MSPYIHTVQYYETVRGGLAHHSDHIRWMEEARMDLLARLGWGMEEIEARGIASPMVSVRCRFRRPARFGDRVAVEVRADRYTGVTLFLSYRMIRVPGGELLAEGRTSQCFVDGAGKPVILRKVLPELDRLLKGLP